MLKYLSGFFNLELTIIWWSDEIITNPEGRDLEYVVELPHERKKHTQTSLGKFSRCQSRLRLYVRKGGTNLTVRKVCGQDQIHYLRCRCCQEEFSELKNTALWNSKIPEGRAVSVGEYLADGCGINRTARLVKVDPSTVRRLNRKVGRHGQQYHEQEVHDVAVTELQADERHGFACSKQQPAWEAELMDPKSKFILAHVQGARDESLIRPSFAGRWHHSFAQSS